MVALYVLRAHFDALGRHTGAFALLIVGMVSLFWLGARAESEVGRLDEQLRQMDRTRPR